MSVVDNAGPIFFMSLNKYYNIMLNNIAPTCNYNIFVVSYDTSILSYSLGKRNHYKC